MLLMLRWNVTVRQSERMERNIERNTMTKQVNKDADYGQVETSPMLQLFATTQRCVGKENNTAFSTEPTVITGENAKAFFHDDHTPILFKGGHCLSANFVYAMAIPCDIDNSHSDNPADWVIPEAMASRLQEHGINYWMAASRNHMLTKDKNGVVHTARPRFHVYLPLSAHLNDGDKFVLLCEGCIKTFGSDPKVKSKAQKMFGYGDNTNAFVESWMEGRCIDEVVSDADLTVTDIVPTVPDTSSTRSPKKRNTAFDWFVESGEWRKHLCDLEERDWAFPREENGQLFFQTPLGDKSPRKQDGNIKDGIAYFFSKAPPPFKDNHPYSICDFYAGAMFADISNVGRAKFARQYLSGYYDGQAVSLVEPNIDNPLLKSLLDQVEPIDFYSIAQPKSGKETLKIYRVVTVSEIIQLANDNNWGLAVNNGFVYLYNGNYWSTLDVGEFKSFLGAVAFRFSVPEVDARDYKFRDELYKQFVSDGNLPAPTGSDTTLINLQNGTFEITEDSQRLRKPSPADFLKHQLLFAYQEDATAPEFEKFLNRVLPEPELQMILAEFIGYVFVFNLKLEKVLILQGTGANGKSVFFDIICALLGHENVSCYKLSSITATTSYERAELQNKLLNYASELNGKLETDTFKQLASGEPLEARRIYGSPFMMRRYAKLMFNTNELPREVEHTSAFFRRFIIIPFQQTIPEDEQDPQLAQKIVNSELPGVFNWVLTGLKRLLQNGDFTESDIVREQIEQYRLQSNSLAMFLKEYDYHPSKTKHRPALEFFSEFKNFCDLEGYTPLGRYIFNDRCRKLGFVVERAREGNIIFVETHGNGRTRTDVWGRVLD